MPRFPVARVNPWVNVLVGRDGPRAARRLCQARRVPRLSVLIPARDARATVLDAVRSTLAALPDDAEVLLLDDASSDGTGELVAGLGDRRVRVIRTDVNLGVARGLDRLLAETDAEFVARMDADDVCLPHRFRAQQAAIAGGSDLVFTTFQRFGQGLRHPPLPVGLGPVAGRLALLLDCPAHSTLYARRATLVDAGGYRDAVTEDYDLWLRAAARGARISRLGRPGILLRASAGQVTAQAGFRARVAADPLIAESYRAFVRELWGDEGGIDGAPWMRQLAFLREGPLSAEGRALLEPFIHRFLQELTPLSAAERFVLSRRARRELGALAG